MLERQIGDVRHGFVESGMYPDFVVFGDREETLACLMETGAQRAREERRKLPLLVGDFVRINTIHGAGHVDSKYISFEGSSE